jgi:nucleoside-diphosphate-sugar epimerase
MKVFATGGSGYVGRETIRALRRRGPDLHAGGLARAHDELGWNPPNRDVFREIAEAAT